MANVPDFEQRLETLLSGSQDRHCHLMFDQESTDQADPSLQLANRQGAEDTAEAMLNTRPAS